MISSDRIHRVGGFIIRASMAAVLAGLVLLMGLGADPGEMVVLLPGLAAIAIVFFGETLLPRWGLVVAGASLLVTLAAALVPDRSHLVVSLPEAGAVLILLAWSVRRWSAPQGRATVALLVLALVLIPARGPAVDRPQVLFAEFMLLVGVTVAVAIGSYLYSSDAKRTRILSDVRRIERLDIARDLHDFVAHHVTGTVVMAQAARYIADGDTAAFRGTLADIERSGIEALASMRRLVAVLREDDGGAGVRPVGDLDRLEALVRDFDMKDDNASLYIDPEVIGAPPPPEVAATVFRVVVEALTNVRKHASGATGVAVTVARHGGGVEVAVRDNGGGTRGRLSATGGGFGLMGLTERVAALGGSFEAGPRPEGGWQVVAWLPESVTAAPAPRVQKGQHW
ncbi:sensor histidine kinase [Stackebrandtia soli]|uniref:sensor histidine kinase n=1 Tax=Stackebrandtia soli TaxID=1892856 RepID=UPI0039E79CBE